MLAVRAVPLPSILILLLLGGTAAASPSSLGPTFAWTEASRTAPTLFPDTTDLGVVWTPPPDSDSALRALDRIHAYGATAVRLTRPPMDTIAARAEMLGLPLYIDLPVSHVAASQLSAALVRAEPTLDRVFTLARQYASISHVGLARSADTTVPKTCTVLDRWTERIHAQNLSLRTYYVTPFSAAADQCAGTVDVVLPDLRGHPAPANRWSQWQSPQTRTGLGAIGTWTRPGAASGLQVPHSPERQARHLERILSHLLDSPRSPPAVFVSRWQDRSSPPLPSRRYGLHTRSGRPRPAARVVRGFYTGTQRVFAFPSGSKPPDSYGLLLLSWGLVALLGGLYSQSPFVRQTLDRYFTAHGFYRDALREGRDLNPGTNGMLLGVVTGALGATGILAARLAAARPPTERVLEALPPGLRIVLAGGVEHPITVGVAVGTTMLLLLLTWMVPLVIVARPWTRVSFSQALMLLVWPCWPVPAALPVALATGPHSPISPSFLGVFLLGGSALALVYFTVRVLLDYQAVTGLPWPVVLLLSGLSPLLLISSSLAVLVWQYDIPFLFLWRLATLTS